MTHDSPVELHDHVYGFRPSAHVAGCRDCQARAATIAAERSAIGSALFEVPAGVPEELLRPRRPRLPAAGLIAAAALLAALAGILFHDRKPEITPAVDGHPPHAEAIDRLLAELKSPSDARREIAVLALKAYGEAALPALVKAKVDPAAFGGYRLKLFDAAVDLKLRTGTLDLEFENTALEEIFQELGKKSGVKIVVDPSFRTLDLKMSVTYKVKSLTAINCLKLLLQQFGGDYHCEEGAVVILEAKGAALSLPTPARAPVRIGRMKASAAKLLAEFGSDSPDRRDAARRGLATLGFAAEEALWEGIDSADAEVKGQALDQLRWLYTPAESARPLGHPKTRAVMKTLCERRVTVDFNNAPLTAAADYLRERSEANIHISGMDSPDQLPITFKGSDLPAYSALVLAFEPMRLACVVENNVLLIAPERLLPEEPRRPGIFWTSLDEARRIEEALADFADGPADARDRALAVLTGLGDRALPLLARAAEIFPGDGGERCRTLRARIRRAEDPAGFDEPPAPKTEAQQEILNRTADLDVDGRGLVEILKAYDAKIDVKSGPPGTFGIQAKNVRLGSVLKALTVPFGLEYTFDGDRIVIDRKP